MDASRVRGILPISAMMRFNAPWQCVCGIASMTGRDFPVVDLKAKLGVPDGLPGRSPCVVAIKVGHDENARFFGFVAERVSEVANCRERDFRDGVLRSGGRPRRVLDPDQILTEKELASLWP